MPPGPTLVPDRAAADAEEIGQALEAVTAVVRVLRRAAAGQGGSGGLSLSDFRILKRVHRGMRLASELAETLDVTAATVSGAVEGLVRRGLLERCESQGDRRSVPLRLTRDGEAALDAAVERQAQALRDVLDRLRPGERRAVRLALRSVSRALAGAQS